MTDADIETRARKILGDDVVDEAMKDPMPGADPRMDMVQTVVGDLGGEYVGTLKNARREPLADERSQAIRDEFDSPGINKRKLDEPEKKQTAAAKAEAAKEAQKVEAEQEIKRRLGVQAEQDKLEASRQEASDAYDRANAWLKANKLPTSIDTTFGGGNAKQRQQDGLKAMLAAGKEIPPEVLKLAEMSKPTAPTAPTGQPRQPRQPRRRQRRRKERFLSSPKEPRLWQQARQPPRLPRQLRPLQ